MRKPGMAVILAALVLMLTLSASCVKSMSPEKLKASLEIVDVSSKWVSKTYQPWPPKLVLVPTISFRVKNIGNEPMNYINFNGIFKFQGDTENVGDNFLAAIRKEPIQPGQTSPLITLKSNFGVEGKSLASFKDNPQWRPMVCRLFVQSKGSPHVPLGEYNISREIDFQEPAPVGVEKKEQK